MFTGNEDHSITLNEASAMTARYRLAASSGANLGGFFGKNAINTILTAEACVGIRIYYGRSADAKPTLVIVGVDSKGNDLYKNELAEFGLDCPPNCGEANPLNSSI